MYTSVNFESQYQSSKVSALKGRYISNTDIEPLIEALPHSFRTSVLGHSERALPIYGLKVGTGPKRILIWSQMHGNESTTTKALFDLFNFLCLDAYKYILNTCTLFIIPILNPDGAAAYTRLNANKVDLNRDAIDKSQNESVILKTAFKTFDPHFCFNMHGQRSIFSAGKTSNSAVVSFLSPSENEARTLTKTRIKSMLIIEAINKVLQGYLPNQVGRYDDAFNPNCVGDQFQCLGVPTVLFEAGHYPKDYQREETRKYITLSLITGLDSIAHNEINGNDVSAYFEIPENNKLFNDVIIRNAQLDSNHPSTFFDIAIQFKEVLTNGSLVFVPNIEEIGDLSDKHAHLDLNANFKLVTHPDFEKLSENYEIDFLFVDSIKKILFDKNNLT
tara:strand:+ start:19023 stop:20189 length:1167 start_codon:yes stop_codon:yes gene_type:complete